MEVIMGRLKLFFLLSSVTLCIILLSGCQSKDTDIKKIRDLEFTVVEDADVPEALMDIINEKKKEPFKTSWSDQNYLYIVVGYGEKPTGGYSISVDDLFLTSNAVYIYTNLIGPSEKDYVTNAVTYPYVVVKTEFIDKIVVFN